MYSSISYFANLVTVEKVPFLGVKLDKEFYDVDAVHKVEEGVTHIALVFEINRQIEKVVLSLVVAIKSLQQHSLRVLVWNVFDHDRGAHVLPLKYCI